MHKTEFKMRNDFVQTIWEGGEAARQLWRDMLLPQADEPNNPHDREYYEDLAEVLTVVHSMQNGIPVSHIEIGGYEFWINSHEEAVFVAWIKQLMSKGLDFKQAFDRALQITIENDPNLDHIVFELGEGKNFRVYMWQAQLEDQGIETLEAQQKAHEIVRILCQQHFAKDEDWFDEFDKEICDSIHRKLESARAMSASS